MPSETRASAPNEQGTSQSASPGVVPTKKLFGVPAPVKRVFDRFPLISYEAEEIPASLHKSGSSERNRLFVFIGPEQATKGAPSFNPQCLRWQVSRMCYAICRNSASDIGCF
jgi:metaxin